MVDVIEATYGARKGEAFDLFAADYIDDAFPAVSRLHQESPVFFYQPLNVWCVTKYDDVKNVLKDWKTYSSKAIGLIDPPDDLRSQVSDLCDDSLIIATDPPLHTQLRQPIIKLFNHEALKGVEPALRRRANELIDGFIGRGHCNLMREFAYPVSLATIMVLFNLPTERAAEYRAWSDDFISMLTPQPIGSNGQAPKHPMPDIEVRERWERLARANAFFRDLVDQRQREPETDLISEMLRVRDSEGNQALTPEAVIMNAVGLLTAGHDTTANLIGSMAMLLLRNPDQWNKLQGDSSLLNGAIHETLRRHGSAKALLRHVTQDVTIRGIDIPKDSYLFLMLNAANLDPEVFPDPDRFDITRSNAEDNLTFGFGRHACLGKMIAKLEARVAFEELFRRIPRFRLAEDGLVNGPTMSAVNLIDLNIEW
jgi:cytochrome P450